jgi:hypothetical protein
MFADGDENAFSMSISVGRQMWTTHFYSTSLIEFQGDPRDILNNSDVEDVKRFMQKIADATGRAVRLVPETFDYEGAATYMLIEPE